MITLPIEDTAETRLANTMFLVEATGYEQQMLWQQHAADSQSGNGKLQWKQKNGWLVTVGHLDKRPICVSLVWNELDGHLVCFWEPTSEVVDYKQIKEWFAKHFNKERLRGRSATCDTWNFHHCLHALDDLKSPDPQ